MIEIKPRDFTVKRMEEICWIAEKASTNFILSKVRPIKIKVFDLIINLEGRNPMNLDMELEIVFSSSVKGVDIEDLAEGALNAANAAVEKYLRDRKLDLEI